MEENGPGSRFCATLLEAELEPNGATVLAAVVRGLRTLVHPSSDLRTDKFRDIRESNHAGKRTRLYRAWSVDAAWNGMVPLEARLHDGAPGWALDAQCAAARWCLLFTGQDPWKLVVVDADAGQEWLALAARLPYDQRSQMLVRVVRDGIVYLDARASDLVASGVSVRVVPV